MNIGILLRAPFQQLVETIHETLAQAGYPEIRPAHGVVFQFIGKDGARLTTLAAKAQMTKQSMSYLVEYLEKLGYVERTDDESDKRAKLFRLTVKGWAVVAVAESAIANFEAQCSALLGPEQYKALCDLLIKLNKTRSEPAFP